MSTNNPGDAAPELPHRVYAEQLRSHAVTLIWLGYKRLDAASFSAAEEDAITGELVREMRLVTQDLSSPDWVDRYHIHEQPPQNVAGKRGKRRPKLDIEIECHRRGPRPRLGFEAKRLGRRHSVGSYLGEVGLGAFLDGYYPTTHGEAGMLGYIQEHTSDHWSNELRKSLSGNPDKYRIASGGQWQSIESTSVSRSSCSRHTDTKGHQMFVIHVLLPFT